MPVEDIMRNALKGPCLAGLAAALLLTSALVPGSVAVAQRTRCADGDCREYKAYEGSVYGFCDAVVLSKHWTVDSWETKLRIGEQILKKNTHFVNQELHDAFARYNCNSESTFNYEDASQLADLWTAALGA
jgi:hypothetical protein